MIRSLHSTVQVRRALLAGAAVLAASLGAAASADASDVSLSYSGGTFNGTINWDGERIYNTYGTLDPPSSNNMKLDEKVDVINGLNGGYDTRCETMISRPRKCDFREKGYGRKRGVWLRLCKVVDWAPDPCGKAKYYSNPETRNSDKPFTTTTAPPVNLPPVALDQTVNVQRGKWNPHQFNAYDPEKNGLKYTILTRYFAQSDFPSFQLWAPYGFTIHPPATSKIGGELKFVYEARDNANQTDTATVTMRIVGP